jgi:hypothetical protein
MAEGSKRAAPGKPFQKGQSGNPGGMPKGTRETRNKIAAALDEAFTQDGRDLLVEAIVAGVQTGDSTSMKLAAEYRWGKPVSVLELSGPEGAPLAGPSLDLSRVSSEERRELYRLAEKATKKGENE